MVRFLTVPKPKKMIYNMYKPVGWTSFDVVKYVRSVTKEKKVGHGGTLDPFAEGVLVIGTGKDTKVLTSITGQDKIYTATLTLGRSTNTLDIEGQTVEVQSIPETSRDLIEGVLKQFVGEQTQIPPMFSAKKIKGVRLYKLARKDQEIKRDPIQITIHDMGLLHFDRNSLTFTVTCSKGTYVRVLGKDIAESMGTVGYLTKLVRTAVGNYQVSDSITLEDFRKQWKFIEA